MQKLKKFGRMLIETRYGMRFMATFIVSFVVLDVDNTEALCVFLLITCIDAIASASMYYYMKDNHDAM